MKILSQAYFLAFLAFGSLLVITAKSIPEEQSYDFDPTFGNQEMVAMDPTAPFLNAGEHLFFLLFIRHLLVKFFFILRTYLQVLLEVSIRKLFRALLKKRRIREH